LVCDDTYQLVCLQWGVRKKIFEIDLTPERTVKQIAPALKFSENRVHYLQEK